MYSLVGHCCTVHPMIVVLRVTLVFAIYPQVLRQLDFYFQILAKNLSDTFMHVVVRWFHFHCTLIFS